MSVGAHDDGDGDAIRPFKIAVPDAVLEDLKARLARTRFPDALPGSGWEYGTERAYLKELCAYWRDAYDWRAQEAALNAWPQFMTRVDGQPLHFIHARSKHADALPLLLTHGWPGSVLEFQKILPLLVAPEAHGGRAADAFHVVAPSLPGYGFSGPTLRAGWDTQRIAEAEMELMRRLGYTRYGAQGGDWGAIVTVQVGRLAPPACVGIHLNMVMALRPQDTGDGDGGGGGDGATPAFDAEEERRLARARKFEAEGTGYQAIQSTRPQTLAYGLTDSPAGLAAWIVEKFRAWGDTGGDVESVFSRDTLLTNIMIYWVTGTINSSMRLYYEVRKSGRVGFTQGRVEVPTACASFPFELYNAPRAWAERHYNVTRWTRFERGGHFAALEEPQALAADLRAHFRGLRAAS